MAAYADDRPGPAPESEAALGGGGLPYGLWGEGFGSWRKEEGNGNAASLDRSTGGFVIGADGAVNETIRMGLAGGFTRTRFDIDSRLSSGSTDSVFGVLYGSAAWGNFSLKLGAGYAWHDFDVSRMIRFPGFSDSTHVSYDGWTAQAFGELGYQVRLGSLTFEPFVGASVLRLHADGFTEEGEAAALVGSSQDHDLATGTLGLRTEAWISPELPLTARALVGWRHAYGDVNPESLLAFPDGGSAFAVAGTPVDRDALVAEAGLDWQASDAISLGIAYSGQAGSRAQEHVLKGGMIWRFGSY